jgi:hypothetical protein
MDCVLKHTNDPVISTRAAREQVLISGDNAA